MRPLKLGVAICAAVLLIAGWSTSAQARCYGSTPASQAFPDATGDGEGGLAPEITGVVASTDGNCGLSVDPTILGAGPDDLLPDESVGIYMDTDGNPATGSPIWDGADKAVITIGELGFDDPPGLGTWNGSSFDFTGGSNLTGIDAAGFSSNIDQLGIAGPTTMGIQTISLYEGIFDNYSDFAPEVGASPFAFPVSFSTAAPPPPPPAPVQTFAPTITPQQSGGKPSGFCAVPRLRGKKVKQAMAALKKAHCRYKVVKVRKKKKAGRVVSSSPSAGVLTKGIVKVKVATKARAHSAAARVALYASIEHRMSSAEAARPGR